MTGSKIGVAQRAALFALIGIIVLATGAPARAADDPWRFSITPYIWLPSVDTTAGQSSLLDSVDLHQSTVDILDTLDLPILFCGEVQVGKFGLLYDFQYLRFSDSGTAGVLVDREFDATVVISDATLGLYYRAIDVPNKFTVDPFAGARGVYAKTEIELSTPAIDNEREKYWVDPIVGLKAQWRLADRWSLLGYGDIGGFGVGSDLTYQLMGVVGFELSDHIAFAVGYRYFFVDYDDDGFELNAHIYGPIVGLTFNF